MQQIFIDLFIRTPLKDCLWTKLLLKRSDIEIWSIDKVLFKENSYGQICKNVHQKLGELVNFVK